MSYTLIALALLVAPDAELKPRVAVTDNLTVKVSDPQKASDALVAAAESVGGYFTSRTDTGVSLRIPTAHAAKIFAIAEGQGIVIARSRDTSDFTESLEEQSTLLASRRQVLERYFDVLKSAHADAVVSVEHEMTSLIAEIEELEGSIRLEEHNLAYATLDVSYQFRDRRAPNGQGVSSFKWLNTINLGDLLGDFQNAH